MRPLSPHSLQAFRLTVATGSISEAAKALGRSQPAVSRLLQNLEAELGFPLFNRVKNRLVPTSVSLEFYEEVQQNFKYLEGLRAFARDLADGRARALSIGATSSLSSYIVPKIVGEYHRHNRDRRLTLLTQPSASIAQKVLLQELDIGLIVSRELLPGLEVVRQYRLSAICVTPPEHPLSKKQVVTPEDIVEYPLIIPIVDTITGSQVENIFRIRNLQPNIAAQCQLTQVVSLLVSQGMGVGLVDGWMASYHKESGGTVLRFLPELPFDISLVMNSNARMSQQISSFVEICDRFYDAQAKMLERLPS
jgi:DNA-binding transcriptional LysR family regulator